MFSLAVSAFSGLVIIDPPANYGVPLARYCRRCCDPPRFVCTGHGGGYIDRWFPAEGHCGRVKKSEMPIDASTIFPKVGRARSVAGPRSAQYWYTPEEHLAWCKNRQDRLIFLFSRHPGPGFYGPDHRRTRKDPREQKEVLATWHLGTASGVLGLLGRGVAGGCSGAWLGLAAGRARTAASGR